MNEIGGFKSLIVWQKAMLLVQLVYGEVRKFPQEEKFALADQLRRAVVSIPSNIAEGAGRGSDNDYGHFLSIATGSLYETITQLEIARNLGYILDNPQVNELIDEIGRMLLSLKKKYSTTSSRPWA